ncbi:MAG: RagB/SusD family nutrient uptake outer membrane protein [Bacteroidota bacterium]|nr:RagB/SusD family nutrient uptake outer membrane protein [Bacteroidota bacterium]
MKNAILKYTLLSILALSSCSNLDLLPLSEASSGNWYSSDDEIEMAANEFYKIGYWSPVLEDTEQESDNFTYRNSNRNEILNGTLNGQAWYVITLWSQCYKGITLANILLGKTENAPLTGLSADKVRQFRAEAYFIRACKYATLLSYYGDVVYLTSSINIEQALQMGRMPKKDVIPLVYADFDNAIADLPVSYMGSLDQRFTKGAALAMKARFALYNSDWAVAAKAAKACMDLGVYDLHSDFTNLFLSTTRNTKENIFLIPRSIDNGVTLSDWLVNNELTRNATGYAAATPSWDLLAAFLCTDGLPIDESPLFDPHNPFKNRDPRCVKTIVEFGTRHLNFDYNPHPDSLTVMNYQTGKRQKNNDNRAVAQYASFNALVWKKGIDATWLVNGKKVDNDYVIIRFADVLLMYAESKIELNEIDATVLNAINRVRARGYGVRVTDVDKYPAVITTNQAKLRQTVRLERRVEFANEGLRYMDLIRWRLASKALNTKNYGILYPATLLRQTITSKGLWFWPSTPKIDDDGIADFSAMENAGQIAVLSQRVWDDRQYLWPIPTDEISINSNIRQNPGY